MLNDTDERYGVTWMVTPDLLGILSADAHFVATNPAWQSTLGWSAEEIETRPFFEFLHPDDMLRTQEAFAAIQEGQPILQFKNRYRHKDGTYRWLSWNCVPERGKFYCSARDVTQSVANTSALADRDEEAQLREQFIAVLGHDLRNPLAALQSGFRVLGKEAALSDRGQGVIDASLRTVARMSGLIDDLLDFARTRLGSGLSLDISDGSDLATAIEATVEELRSVHPDLNIETDIDLPVNVRCDVGRICQLCSNLTANAVTHGEQGGLVRLDAKSDEAGLTIEVRNQGETMSEKVIAHLFEPFVREQARPSQEGLGLGLFICSQIASAHGGDLTVRSEERLTTFRFDLPRQTYGRD
ncbi:PAS domain-containing sensor histidine kinase [Qipengyuania atrilutea]|uniref:histidine kinase n=1 Tax=Qipengyuania atrilutea TaxID=2744473 RepID=A0A850H0Q7_9SPHN|nr:PAS domain-containing sensor histidine kinase [Actirhodobacter atriluteus]NVD43518.1 PAS domain-containing sensor histidine kinase [Actirhodobacter atriluteus]